MSSFAVALDGRVLAPGTPLVRVDDPLFLRGDGVFETLLVRDRTPTLLRAHLTRLADSAALAGLPPPDLAALGSAAGVAADRCSADDAILRIVHGRGHGGDGGGECGGVVAFVAVSPVPERVAAARRDGLSVMTLERGPGAATPWSLAAAKSTSYAHHVAALRHAARRGFDDVVFVVGADDDTVLEGPRSTVLVASGGALMTPPAELPILAGTTVRAVFAAARAYGVPCREEALSVTDLRAAEGVWLLSAVTLAARVRSLDGVVMPAGRPSIEIADLIDLAIHSDVAS